MGTALTDITCTLLMTAIGVLLGWWLRRLSAGSAQRTQAPMAGLDGASTLESQPHVDRLTGLSCRAAFEDDVQRRVAEWKRVRTPVSILLVRIDDFQEIVRRRRSPASRVLLAAMSQFLRAVVREMDHVARYDEYTFGIILPGATYENALAVGDRIAQAVSRCRLPLDGGELRFSVSTGTSHVKPGDGAADLLRRAETDLESGVRPPRNRKHAVKQG